MMRVLGVETSCDETGLAIYDSDQGLVGHLLHSQVDIHSRYGGVVPELASRDHVRKLAPLLKELLDRCALQLEDLHGVAYTRGPGLVGALMVGAGFGRALAFALGVPAAGVHHMEAHLLAPMLETEPPEFPFVALLVSGGHTQLVRVNGFGDYRLLGESLDDAAGEAFDKTASLLGLGYPGGPQLAELAEHGTPGRQVFPRPMTDRPGLDFSFSGLKTAVLTRYREHSGDPRCRADIALGFEQAVVDTLLIKCRRALAQTGLNRLVLAGGVAANRRLRQAMASWAAQHNIHIHYPRSEFCTDNGAMVAYVGCRRLLAGSADPLAWEVRARWPLEELSI